MVCAVLIPEGQIALGKLAQALIHGARVVPVHGTFDRALEIVRELAELVDIHVVTTLMARGAFPDDHPLCLGMPGMHGNATAITAMQKSFT